MDTIELRDALNIMESGATFSLTAVKYDRNRKTGGELMKFRNVIYISQQASTGIRKIKLPDGQLRAIHQRLIIEFNNKTVIW